MSRVVLGMLLCVNSVKCCWKPKRKVVVKRRASWIMVKKMSSILQPLYTVSDDKMESDKEESDQVPTGEAG